MKVSLGAGGLFALFTVACGSPSLSAEPTATTTEGIQDGTADTSSQYPFVVAVIENSQQVGLCSGALLAPNLVATARHCVTTLTGSGEIDCATSTFGSNLPVSELLVTNDTKLSSKTHFYGVKEIVVPTGAQQSKVCGNDIALLILDQNITLPQYVTPTLNPPMSDPRYSISVTAIGYGIDTPLDMTGMTAGTRRIHENVGLVCVPNDPSFLDCYGAPMVSQFLAEDEFVSGDASTCEGDSGSGAFDQGSFDRGQWVSFGVLSRGATDADSGTCIQPIYSRFDAWSQLLVDGATKGAVLGGYSVPPWAVSSSAGTEAGATVNVSEAGGSAGEGGALIANGSPCGADGLCESSNCVSTDDVHFVCASPCTAGACLPGFSCLSGFCFESPDAALTLPTAPAAPHPSGCSVARAPRAPAGDAASFASCMGFGSLLLGTLAFRRRSQPPARARGGRP